MTTQEKGKIIGEIIAAMRSAAHHLGKPFDEGDMFFSLAFKSGKELKKIHGLALR